ncbi:MAG: hypothetical protein U5L09_07170 [Bacteroidales bacterium]|nr:hypothetical protein [Bacteroidales bacterium]
MKCNPATRFTSLMGNNAFVDFFYTTPCEDAPISFTVDTIITDTDNVTDYLWDFGNGKTSSMMNPVIPTPCRQSSR